MIRAPEIVDRSADQRFRGLAERAGFDPDARFVGGYVDWEWRHARHVFDSVAPVTGRRVLELGSNVGATAIVLATLGADVVGVDPNPVLVELARVNATRFGRNIRIEHVPDTTHLPFPSASFDLVCCNSVLEYVAPSALAGVLRELDRVVREGGIVAILGTSNRLWPREQHSRRWLVGYLPRAVDPFWPGPLPRRGITVTEVRRALSGYDDLIASSEGRLFVTLKERMGTCGWKLSALRVGAWLSTRAGVSPGWLGPTLTMLLRKPRAAR